MAAETPPRVQGAFGLPFAEQEEFFRNKLHLPSERWDDIKEAGHDRGFVVAGATKADLLADLHRAISEAKTRGGLEDFRARFDEIVGRHGWTGWTGEDSPAGRAWRTRVIYETNLYTSYAAGRYRQLTASPNLRYWLYRHDPLVVTPRPQHLAWDGLVLPREHAFWKTHFPPNGWGCKCRVVGIERPEDARDLGGNPDRALPAGWDKIDEATGAPRGIGRGWGYAPGASWHPDLDRYPYDLARDVVAANMADGVFKRWQAKIAGLVSAELAKPEYAGLDKAATIQRLREQLAKGEAYPVAVMDKDKQALLGVSTQVVQFSDYDAVKQAYSRMGDDNFTADAYLAVQGVMDQAELIVRETGQMSVWFRREGRLMVGVVAQTQTGQGVFLKSLRYGSESDKRRSLAAGTEIFRSE